MKKMNVALCLLVLIGATASHAQSQLDRLTIKLDADSTEADAVKGVIRFRGVSIAQADLSVRADAAESSSLDFADSTWTFTGNVRFASADTRLHAQHATLKFASQELTTANLDGAPLVFEQTRDGDVRLTASAARLAFQDSALATAAFTGTPVEYSQTANAKTTSSRAQTLHYDANAGTIDLLGNAWIGDEGKEIKGNRITYNFKTRSYAAASDDDGNERVTITITPPKNNGTEKK